MVYCAVQVNFQSQNGVQIWGDVLEPAVAFVIIKIGSLEVH